MMVRDPLSDLVSRIKNGYMASLGNITMPKSKLREAVLKILSSEKYVGKVTSDDQGLTVELLYKSKSPVITEIVRVSKPGSRVYMGFKSLRLVLGGMGIQILSTPKGIMTGSQARKLKVGGEVICKVW
ncbi:30S ribosomal protein S8 [Candidatus Amesbacteria bacterium]|nr:30S ribosomal protein S8 [Candidatus Amesbacteria bacterium]